MRATHSHTFGVRVRGERTVRVHGNDECRCILRMLRHALVCACDVCKSLTLECTAKAGRYIWELHRKLRVISEATQQVLEEFGCIIVLPHTSRREEVWHGGKETLWGHSLGGGSIGNVM